MRLVAIYNVWDDWDFLQESIKHIIPLIDGIVIVSSLKSNFGEDAVNNYFFTNYFGEKEILAFEIEPDLSLPPAENERNKRNFGLSKARELGFTHFIMMDADEFYEPQEFLKEKERFQNPDLLGLVCKTKVYFKKPIFTVPDRTLVPFIHKITPDLCFTWNINYPFAWTILDGIPKTHSREIRIDPTRQMNLKNGVEWSNITMHHMSWIRSDVKKKIRNSTARQNIEQSTIVKDYINAEAGYYCQFYNAKIESCENLFNIPDIIDLELCPKQESLKT